MIELQSRDADGTFDDVEDIDLTVGKRVGRGYEIRPNRSLTITWNPAKWQERKALRVGHTYRFMIYTVEALRGGGAVYASPAFKFTGKNLVKRR